MRSPQSPNWSPGSNDASLDAFKPHAWQRAFNVFRQASPRLHSRFQTVLQSLNHIHGHWPTGNRGVNLNYRTFPSELTANHVLQAHLWQAPDA